ncbi:hypothetical protein TNCT_614961 [Trichonephila clavata]|uniref:Uncharacterized protein n=1 Tax=Trichonephila clavata TaxID=2740835 RepID=A0A8X6HRM2_TRICU|nr:hypothetical protein TNCT_614961 [Trichonephila clavata]
MSLENSVSSVLLLEQGVINYPLSNPKGLQRNFGFFFLIKLLVALNLSVCMNGMDYTEIFLFSSYKLNSEFLPSDGSMRGCHLNGIVELVTSDELKFVTVYECSAGM